MKWCIYNTCLSISVILLIFSCSQHSNKCIIKGKTIGLNDSSVIIVRAVEDFRFDGIIIPIIKGTFKYELCINQPEGYYLKYKSNRQKGEWHIITFIAEQGRVNLSLYPENEFDRNVIVGGELNNEYQLFNKVESSIFDSMNYSLRDSMNVLIETDKYYSDTMKSLLIRRQISTGNELYKAMQLTNDLKNEGKDLSEQAKTLKSKIEKVAQDRANYRQEYIRRNPSLVSFFILYQDIVISGKPINLEMAESNFTKLAENYPNHPYVDLISNILEAKKNIRIGGKFIDFSAPDLNGQIFKLSDVIKGKVALLDLWSSWCGPCIAYSRNMIPVYNEFKSNDFVIVGVSADKNAERLVNMNKQENYPWINLVEVNNQNKIWEKYHLINSGGKAFLIDKNGIVIAIQPTASELRDILSKELH